MAQGNDFRAILSYLRVYWIIAVILIKIVIYVLFLIYCLISSHIVGQALDIIF